MIDTYNISIADIEAQNAQRSQLSVLTENESVRQQENKLKRDNVRKNIDKLKKNTEIDFQKYTEQLLNVDAVEQIIRQ